jgi:hypothetical protein
MMTYKNRLIFLLSLIAILALFFAGSFIFNVDAGNARASSMIWLDSKLSLRADRIAVSADDRNFELVKKENRWFVLNDGSEYPARNLRVEDFLGIFTKRSPWPVRSSISSSHERFGLDTDTADRLTIYGENSVLLDLLAGYEDSTGQEVYVRRYAQSEVRSGDRLLKTYLTSQVSSWYNLRLIPESEDGKVSVKNVQRLSVYNGDTTLVFTRRNRGWTVSGVSIENPDQNSIENYVSVILNAEGDNFSDSISADDPELGKNRITVELDNGSVVTIRLSEGDESGRRYAHVFGRDYIYSIPSWAASRLFIEPSGFEKQ